jgi:crotonobetainyl-CoA:carnitine CoA-transferase CaiB-like acyl-CoA transferase
MLNMLQPSRYWADLCKHLGRADLISDPRFVDDAARYRNSAACVSELDAIFATKTLDEWRRVLDTVEGVWAPMQSAREIPNDAQVKANGYMAELQTPSGRAFKLVRNPVQYDEGLPELRNAPEMGQDTEAVLMELGLPWDELAKHKQAGDIL